VAEKFAAKLGAHLESFVLVKAKSSIYSLLVVFAKETLKPRISGIHSSSLKFGLLPQITSSKGAVGIGFNVDHSSFCFINAYLESNVK